jgi:hypothetical protein
MVVLNSQNTAWLCEQTTCPFKSTYSYVQYVLPCTKVKFMYCHVLVRTGTYRYVPVHTILPDLVQVYRIPDDDIVRATSYVMT